MVVRNKQEPTETNDFLTNQCLRCYGKIAENVYVLDSGKELKLKEMYKGFYSAWRVYVVKDGKNHFVCWAIKCHKCGSTKVVNGNHYIVQTLGSKFTNIAEFEQVKKLGLDADKLLDAILKKRCSMYIPYNDVKKA